jgi:Fe-S-cluster containining protein
LKKGIESIVSTALAVIQPNPMQFCRRCGDCCREFSIGRSPRVLRENAQAPSADRADLAMFKMLEGRCLGKWTWTPKDKEPVTVWIYGPCRNLIEAGSDGLPACAIHETRPPMCSGFPFYSNWEKPEHALNTENPSPYKGCSYNLSAAHGQTIAGMRAGTPLLELDASEL